ncbi:MAG: SOS response-associated peptidase [Parvularculaceae bacterium]
MCGRFNLISAPERLSGEFDLAVRENFPPRYNIAPTQPIALIRMDEKHKREFALARWGFIPSWAKKDYLDRMGGKPLINARGETVSEKPTFRSAFKRRRCLIPADGFYEWKGEKGGRQPYLIKPEKGGLFAFAGLWETAHAPDGGEIDTAAIITAASGGDLQSLHDREPVVIAHDDYERWLGADERDAPSLLTLLRPQDAHFWAYHPVSKAVNNARLEGEELAQEIGQNELF